jgi:epidermal growth factor receptor substrate 15
LSDRDKDGKLTLDEFVIASVLIFGRKQGVPIPTTLPAELTNTLAALNKPQVPAGAVATPLTRVDSVGGKEKLKRQASTKDKKSSGSKKKSKWAVTPTEKKKYREIFQEKSQGGYISGQQAVSLFTKSKLGRDDLAKIWALADMDRDNQLSQQEFVVAMHLITKRVAGDEIPETVPASLVESASSSAATSSKSDRKLKTQVSTAKLEPSVGPVLQPTVAGASDLMTDESRFGPLPPQQSVPVPSSVISTNPLATNTTTYTVAAPTLAQLGIPDKIMDSYDPTPDSLKVSEITDLPALQQLLARVGEEVRNLKLQTERQRLLEETLTERVSFKTQQSQLLERRRQQSERIFQNYSEDIQADEEDLQATQEDIEAVIADLERQQTELRAPGTDVNALRQKRRELTQEANQLKVEFGAQKEEYARLAAELEALRSSDAVATTAAVVPNAASFSDHGFNADFDEKFDFTATNNSSSSMSSSGFEDNFDFSAASTTRFSMPGSVSGTMTPAHDFADEPAHEPDTDWLGQTGLHTPAEPNTDFFGGNPGFGGDANWADFGANPATAVSPGSGRRPRKSANSKREAKGELKKQVSKKKVKDATGPTSPAGTNSSKDKKKK